MSKNRLLMETTKISADRSAAEVVAELVAHGARSINTEYDSGRITGLRWTMRISGRDVLFDMPARVSEVYKLLQRESPGVSKDKLKEKAERVAWRQLLRWVQAQIAMIEVGMAETAEVFMPFIVLNPDSPKRLFQAMMESQFKALPVPKS